MTAASQAVTLWGVAAASTNDVLSVLPEDCVHLIIERLSYRDQLASCLARVACDRGLFAPHTARHVGRPLFRVSQPECCRM